jgi:hypothetical protein
MKLRIAQFLSIFTTEAQRDFSFFDGFRGGNRAVSLDIGWCSIVIKVDVV